VEEFEVATGETHSEDVFSKTANAIVSILSRTVRTVFCDNTTRVCEGELCFRERYAVLFLVLAILLRIPLEPSLGHGKA
jgi:hypothetical protein